MDLRPSPPGTCLACIEIEDETDNLGCLGLWGPESRRLLASVSASDLSDAVFPYLAARTMDVNGVTVWAQRISYVGELGWELYINTRDCLQVWDTLMAAGKKFGIRPAGYKALDALRIEKGYLYWSGDITPEDNPLEAGLTNIAGLSKKDFNGKAALLKIKEQGLKTRLMALTMDAGGNLYGGESVYNNGKVIDRIRTGGYGYTIGKDIGLVYLPLELAKAGSELEVQVIGELIKAYVTEIPLVDPKGKKLKSSIGVRV